MSFDPVKRSDGNDAAITIYSLSKCYRMYEKPHYRLKQFVNSRLSRFIRKQPVQYFREFWALKDISLEIKRGETVGIIGQNGSGKSTLLQLICGTLTPTSGDVQTNGRVAALLELGSGFNPEFTGRENVYLNAAVLGLSRKDVDERFDAIAAFADIGNFIDEPVKKYSSGMYVRLAFAVAISVDPEILIVDEALSVGDELFQRKCFARIEQLRNKGVTVLFVSHSGGQITQLCDRAVLLDSGEKLLVGEPKTVVNYYLRLLYAPDFEKHKIRHELREHGALSPNQEHPLLKNETSIADQTETYDLLPLPVNTISYVANGARIQSVSIKSMTDHPVNLLRRGRRYRYTYKVVFDRDVSNARFGILIKTKEGVELGGGMAVYGTAVGGPPIRKGQVANVDISFDCRLNPGTYFTNAGVTGGDGGNDVVLHRMLDAYAFKVMPEINDLATAVVDFDCKPTITISSVQ